jgi:alpha-N-arabinofuranosidase
MHRRKFLKNSMAATASLPLSGVSSLSFSTAVQAGGEPKVAVLVVDTDRVTIPIDQRIYEQFLEHIDHSVEDGLFGEQIRGSGFEGEDFKT